MPKLAIYVPKKEMRVIEKWRDEINFSQVFMRALMQEISERSRRVRAQRGQVTAAAKYYQRTLSEASQPLVDFGHKLGARHVLQCRLSPELVLRLAAIARPRKTDAMQSDDVATIETAIGRDSKCIDDYANQQGYDEQCYPTWRLAVYRGYLGGVGDAWKRVCEKMREMR